MLGSVSAQPLPFTRSDAPRQPTCQSADLSRAVLMFFVHALLPVRYGVGVTLSCVHTTSHLHLSHDINDGTATPVLLGPKRRYKAFVVSPPSSTAQMALSSAQGSALLVLLEAPSKQAVDAFFCSCFRERHAAGPIDDARVAEIVESLGLSTPLVAAPLQRAAVALIGKVLYVDASAEQTAALFPPDFHSSLQALLTKVRPALALH